MLTPAQVLPFLQHDDPRVRDLAISYFTGAHDPSPATAEDVWRMLDTNGAGKDESAPYSALESLPQTEKSLRRTVEALRGASNEVETLLLPRVILAVPFGILNRFRDLIEEAPLDTASRAQINQRFELSSIPASELWEKLSKTASQVDQSEAYNPELMDAGTATIEALSRSPESSQWALAELGDKSRISQLKAWSIQLLGTIGHRQSATLIAEYLTLDPDADFVIEAAQSALMKIGGNAVVQILRDQYPTLARGLQFHAAAILGTIKTPQSELALNHLIGKEQEIEYRTALADAACKLAATDAGLLTQLYQIIKTSKWDKKQTELDERVVALFTMVNNNVPELAQWRVGLDDTKARPRARKSAHREWFERAQRKQKAIKPISMELQDDADVIWDTVGAPADAQPGAIAAPIRRSAAKVGRNDPCPCGSGKKHKKCCGK